MTVRAIAAAIKPGEKAGDGGRAEKLFGRLDANNDGKVTLEEVPEERRPMFEKLVERGDKDGDKALSKEEFAAAMPGGEGRPDKKPGKGKEAKLAKKGRPEPGQLFGRLDANSDGKVTLDEIPEERRPMFEKLIERGDKDGDKALSKEEFAAAMPGGEGRPEKKPGKGNAAKLAKKDAPSPVNCLPGWTPMATAR